MRSVNVENRYLFGGLFQFAQNLLEMGELTDDRREDLNAFGTEALVCHAGVEGKRTNKSLGGSAKVHNKSRSRTSIAALTLTMPALSYLREVSWLPETPSTIALAKARPGM